MKALTIRQPWGHAIVHGVRGRVPKRLENRTWEPTILDVGERFAIHAGKRCEPVVLDYQGELARGAVIGVARFGGVVRSYADVVNNPHVNMVGQLDWYDGGLAWVLHDVVALVEPVHVAGTQGLWRLPDDVEALVVRRLPA